MQANWNQAQIVHRLTSRNRRSNEERQRWFENLSTRLCQLQAKWLSRSSNHNKVRDQFNQERVYQVEAFSCNEEISFTIQI